MSWTALHADVLPYRLRGSQSRLGRTRHSFIRSFSTMYTEMLCDKVSEDRISRVVRCFIGAIFGHSQVPGPLRGLEIPANEFSLCDSSP